MGLILPIAVYTERFSTPLPGVEASATTVRFDDPDAEVLMLGTTLLSVTVEGESVFDPEIARFRESAETLVIDSLVNQAASSDAKRSEVHQMIWSR